MGLKWSADNILSWRSQHRRMLRWLERLRSISAKADFQDRVDFYLAFFVNCYSLRDWFINSGAISSEEMDSLIQSDESMRLCRDICNRSKHLKLNRRASADADFSIVREYDHFSGGEHIIVFYLDRRRDLFDVAASCVEFWKNFLRTHNPPEPPNPFASPSA